MKSKLGFYYISVSGLDVAGMMAKSQPRVVVSMDHSRDAWAAAKQASPNTFIIGRHYVDDSDQLYEDDPEGRAETFFNRMRPDAEKMRGIYDAWMSYNEIALDNDAQSPEKARRLSRFHARWGDLMRGAGLVSCAYSFSTGTPEPEMWQYLSDGLCHCDLLSLHEYSAPTMDKDQGWLCLRYRKAINALPPEARRPVVITECGIDGGPINRAQEGWSKFTSEAGYLATLQWYDGELQKDDYVIGATIFAMNGWGKDGSFGIAGLNSLQAYVAQGGQPPAVSLKPPVITSPEPIHTTSEPTQPTAPTIPSTPSVPSAPGTYTVQKGDTLSKIARQLGTTVAAVAAANNISNPNLIRVGQVLTIPTATPAMAFGMAAAPVTRPRAQATKKKTAATKTPRAKKTPRSTAKRGTTRQANAKKKATPARKMGSKSKAR